MYQSALNSYIFRFINLTDGFIKVTSNRYNKALHPKVAMTRSAYKFQTMQYRLEPQTVKKTVKA